MNYVSLDKAYPNTFMSTAFQPEYSMKNNAMQPSYEDLINEKINVNNDFYCDSIANHIKTCPHCKERLKKIITEQIKDQSTPAMPPEMMRIRPKYAMKKHNKFFDLIPFLLLFSIFFLFFVLMVSTFFDVSFKSKK